MARLADEYRIAVIEGDIETTADADRLAPSASRSCRSTPGRSAATATWPLRSWRRPSERLDLHDLDLLIVENVGNLVCPAEFDIGEDRKVVLLSVTEGEDKPLKYPLMFHESTLAVVTKVDLLPHLDLDLELLRANLRRANPEAPVLLVSAKTRRGHRGAGSTGCARASRRSRRRVVEPRLDATGAAARRTRGSLLGVERDAGKPRTSSSRPRCSGAATTPFARSDSSAGARSSGVKPVRTRS